MALRFHQFAEPMRLPRDELMPGRRLSGDGVLSGALHSLGYYSTDICLGSPPRRYDLIVDTGSSLTAVPCSSCAQCGEHICGRVGRFDTSLSQTAKLVPCSAPASFYSSLKMSAPKCEPCMSGQCSYSVHYTEGSSIRGQVISDVAHFSHNVRGDGPGRGVATNVSTRVFFGCQTSESGMFQRQRADGILGLQASLAAAPRALLAAAAAAAGSLSRQPQPYRKVDHGPQQKPIPSHELF